MTANESKRSRREEAEYWESHTLDEVTGEKQEKEVVVRKPLSSVLSIRLDPQDVKQLREMGSAQGVGPTTMARMLILRCLGDPSSSLPQITLGAAGSSFYADVPQGVDGPEFVVFSKQDFESFLNKSITIFPGQGAWKGS